MYNGRTYVPAKVVAEALGASVDYNSSGNGTVVITSGNTNDNAGQPTKDAATNSNTTTNTSTNLNSSIKSVEYDPDKQSTWLKLEGITITDLPDSKANFRLLEVNLKNVSTNTVEFSSYGDIQLSDINDDDLSSIIGIGSKYSSKGKIEPGKTKTFYKGFVSESIGDLCKLEYYPLSAKKGDRTIIYKK